MKRTPKLSSNNDSFSGSRNRKGLLISQSVESNWGINILQTWYPIGQTYITFAVKHFKLDRLSPADRTGSFVGVFLQMYYTLKIRTGTFFTSVLYLKICVRPNHMHNPSQHHSNIISNLHLDLDTFIMLGSCNSLWKCTYYTVPQKYQYIENI